MQQMQLGNFLGNRDRIPSLRLLSRGGRQEGCQIITNSDEARRIAAKVNRPGHSASTSVRLPTMPSENMVRRGKGKAVRSRGDLAALLSWPGSTRRRSGAIDVERVATGNASRAARE